MLEFNKWKVNNTIPNFDEELIKIIKYEWKNMNKIYYNLNDNIFQYCRDKIKWKEECEFGKHNEYVDTIGSITLNTAVLNTEKDTFNLYEKLVYDIADKYLQTQVGDHDINNFTVEFWTGFDQHTPINSCNFHHDYSETDALFYNNRIGPTYTLLYYVNDCEHTPTMITSILDVKQLPENKEFIVNFPVKGTCISFRGCDNLHGPVTINKKNIDAKARQTISIQIYDYKFKPLSRPFYKDCLNLTTNIYNRNSQILTFQHFDFILNKTRITNINDYNYLIYIFKQLCIANKEVGRLMFTKINSTIENLNLTEHKTIYFDLNTSP